MTINFSSIFKRKKQKTEANYKQDIQIKQYGEQFKKLIEKGIDLPVVLL